jgi:hypothetical protein
MWFFNQEMSSWPIWTPRTFMPVLFMRFGIRRASGSPHLRWNYMITMWPGWQCQQGRDAWGANISIKSMSFEVQRTQNYRTPVSGNSFGVFTGLWFRYDPTEKHCIISRERNDPWNTGICKVFRAEHCGRSSSDSVMLVSEYELYRR